MEVTSVPPSPNISLNLQNTENVRVTDEGISADEIALYDRQIRLWGVQAQEKIRNAKVLLIRMKALANEVAKNLVLAGIYSLTIVDHELVSESDLGAQFFVTESDIGRNRAEAAAVQVRKLNPRVQVIVDQSDIREKRSEFFSAFDTVIALDLHPNTLSLINNATRLLNKPFYAAGVHGLYGFLFSDLIQHDFVVERERGNRNTAVTTETRTRSVMEVKEKKENSKIFELVTKREIFSTWLRASENSVLPDEFLKRRNRLKAVTPILSCFRALWSFIQVQDHYPRTADDLKLFTRLATQKHKTLGLPDETLRSEILRKFLQNIDTEIVPVTAILGGQLAQDVINVLGARQQPIQNIVIFDGYSIEAPVFSLHPEDMSSEVLLPASNVADKSSVASGESHALCKGIQADAL